MKLSIVAAIAQNRAIGKDNQLLWKLSDDLKHFKKLTLTHPVIMGRKTYESLGRPLPGRLNVVITGNPDFAAPACKVVKSPGAAVQACKNSGAEEAFIIGGGEIYKEFMNIADYMHITEVKFTPEDADTFFPEYEADNWTEISNIQFSKNEKNEFDFDIVVLKRKV